MRIIRVGLLVVFMLAVCVRSEASRFVWINSPSEGTPYDSWDTAAHDIATAVAAAGTGETIFVTNGTYIITEIISVNNQKIVESVNGRDVTIINGSATTDPCVNLNDATLDGFTLTNGVRGAKLDNSALIKNCNVFGNHKVGDEGGGLFMIGSSTASGCTVRGNSARNGGGIYLLDGSVVVDCIVEDNQAEKYAGIYMYNWNAAGQAPAIVTNCVVRNNVSSQQGSGGVFILNEGFLFDSSVYSNIYAGGTSTTSYGGAGVGIGNASETEGVVRGCTIFGNSSTGYGQGGGGYIKNGGLFEDCIISNNAASAGGGVYVVTAGKVTDCTIVGNTAVQSGGGYYGYQPNVLQNSTVADNKAELGGGVYMLDAGTVSNCIITGNMATDFGGGFYAKRQNFAPIMGSYCTITLNYSGTRGGGVYMLDADDAVLRNCLVVANEAKDYGGGIDLIKGHVESCTVVRNKVQTQDGGGVAQFGGSITNTIIYHNTSGDTNPDIRIWGGLIGYSCASDLTHDPSGTHNYNTDPLFKNSGSGSGTNAVLGDYALLGSSDLIDAGYGQAWMGTAVDLDGNARIVGGIVDFGVYEYAPAGTTIIIR